MKKITLVILLLIIVDFSFAQIVNIPDANFKQALLLHNTTVDTNHDGEIQVSEAENTLSLSLNEKFISSMEGIEFFVNLESLSCKQNNISSLDVTQLTSLEYLDCSFNDLDVLDVSQNVNLEYLSCGVNNLSSLDLSNNTALTELLIRSLDLNAIDLSQNVNLEILWCDHNNLTNLDLTQNVSLINLYCDYNSLTELDISQNTLLTRLECAYNNLNSLDVSQNLNLTHLICLANNISDLDISQNLSLNVLACRNNNLSSLDITNNRALHSLYCYNNPPLESLFLKNGFAQFFANDTYLGLPNLRYVCIEDAYADDIRQIIEFHNSSVDMSSLVINNYCSFVPGGEYYTVTGSQRLDLNSDGCTDSDPIFPNLTFNISNGFSSGSFISNSIGDYNIFVQYGAHTITPQLENSNYYSVTPPSVTVDFPTEVSPNVQDFCITPNGNYNDLEVVVVPQEAAVPGFSPYYKIVYKNKGTTTLSGTISLDFEDNYMDFLSASPTEDANGIGNLEWNYTNLQPFEIREIELNFNLNTPTDPIFPLNSGDQLDFTANIYPIIGDETVIDNTFGLKQIVVNSYDPNDIRCLEGIAILPEFVGEYVHYLIRFENLGTANAVNVVVKDVIDQTKFDVSSIVPLNSSHDFTTRIREDNIVEFIFENIQLPFNDANNDGYVLFKIKTLETLQVGDTFSNQAEIYFDFNFPIITNNYTTTIQQRLSVDEFNSKDIKLFPNPVKNSIIVKSEDSLDAIKIFDSNGRSILHKFFETFSTEHMVSVESLQPGIYFMEALSNEKKQVLKFIKL